jgi:hypothetical protein
VKIGCGSGSWQWWQWCRQWLWLMAVAVAVGSGCGCGCGSGWNGAALPQCHCLTHCHTTNHTLPLPLQPATAIHKIGFFFFFFSLFWIPFFLIYFLTFYIYNKCKKKKTQPPALYAYTHHFTLYDYTARGFVRPLALL